MGKRPRDPFRGALSAYARASSTTLFGRRRSAHCWAANGLDADPVEMHTRCSAQKGQPWTANLRNSRCYASALRVPVNTPVGRKRPPISPRRSQNRPEGPYHASLQARSNSGISNGSRSLWSASREPRPPGGSTALSRHSAQGSTETRRGRPALGVSTQLLERSRPAKTVSKTVSDHLFETVRIR